MKAIPESIGIIAGRGLLPVEIARNILKKSPQTKIFSIGFAGENNRKMRYYSSEAVVVPLGHMGVMIEYLKSQKLKNVLMAGLIRHTNIFGSGTKLDPLASKIFDEIKDRRADSILGGVADHLQREGITLLPLIDFAGGMLAAERNNGVCLPGKKHTEDIEFGFGIAKEISRMDIGQTVVVKDRCVVAVESLEGTDMCILRGGRLAGRGSVVIKVAKMHQDLRFDLPVIGPRTMKMMRRTGSGVISVEAGKTCIVDREKTISLANKYNISIWGRGA